MNNTLLYFLFKSHLFPEIADLKAVFIFKTLLHFGYICFQKDWRIWYFKLWHTVYFT